MSTSNRAPRHVWTKEEEGILVECLMELVSMGGWKSDNGMFRPCYLAQLVRMTTEKLPGCRVRATTVIDCRIKTLKRTFQAIAEMRGPACSGFGWNDEKKFASCSEGLLNKPFPYYDELTYVFGRDRATGRFTETFADVGSNEPGGGYDRFDMGDGNEELPPVYSQGIDLSQDGVHASRPSRALEGRTGSSGSKRKKESQQDFDIEAIHLALDQTNEHLRQIAEWSARTLANDNHVRTEFFRILREMPELTSLDRALLQRHVLSCMDDLRDPAMACNSRDDRRSRRKPVADDLSDRCDEELRRRGRPPSLLAAVGLARPRGEKLAGEEDFKDGVAGAAADCDGAKKRKIEKNKNDDFRAYFI
ncbi:retrotransposon protein [Cucumis melo var. makuwa]|uniref:Retrotransposon protein n=1 Tax=Cucumis melo var. makuwa TaxID=1194695 RepID=A0A5A7SQY4_CUCMM|nr:retrotransposon protein [Cucumis melo var. makuwa]TYK21207.1 retrotransposon protein [Cucumis melo var. makuwa]